MVIGASCATIEVEWGGGGDGGDLCLGEGLGRLAFNPKMARSDAHFVCATAASGVVMDALKITREIIDEMVVVAMFRDPFTAGMTMSREGESRRR